MNEKFTPAPWFVWRGTTVNDGSGVAIAEMCIGDKCEANAALIAAAPEMFSLLDEISDGLLDAGGFGNCALAKRIEQLLAKARGEA